MLQKWVLPFCPYFGELFLLGSFFKPCYSLPLRDYLEYLLKDLPNPIRELWGLINLLVFFFLTALVAAGRSPPFPKKNGRRVAEEELCDLSPRDAAG